MLAQLFSTIRIILVSTSHPGNIGATARAMKNMGFNHLSLVNPQRFPSQEATERASGADDILTTALVTPTLSKALIGANLVLGASARPRYLACPQLTARVAATLIKEAALAQQRIAIVFGNEQSGLSNADLALCQRQIIIPADPDFSSLNLAQAVQVITYEVRQAFLADTDQTMALSAAAELATQEELENFYAHLESVLINLHFLNPKNPKYLATRLRRLFARTQMEKREVALWRGILTAITKQGSLE